MVPQVWANELIFSDGTTLQLGSSDVVLIVGPNNAGKSATLRAIRDKLSNVSSESPVLSTLQYHRSGDSDQLVGWLKTISTRNHGGPPDNPIYGTRGVMIDIRQAKHLWEGSVTGLQNLTRLFCYMLTADERLGAANPATVIDFLHEPLNHPIHFLHQDDRLENRLSERFSKAFGVDLIVNRGTGSKIPLHVGQRPQPVLGEDRVSHGYLKRLARLPTVETQGDGMRSFAGVLLHTLVGTESILLIDEPEAFLHPPQARLLGQMLVSDKPSNRQLFVATHSGDILRGVLDGNTGSVRVIRIRREGDMSKVTVLEPHDVKSLWVDPLLRASNILDGVFHERVIVGESDGDARFFAAVTDALYEGPLAGERRPDVMFTHCGGKDRLPLVVQSLRALGVPVRAVTDFDILNDEQPLRKLVEAAGGDWGVIQPLWNSVKTAIDGIKPQLSSSDVKKDIELILASVKDVVFPKEAKKQIDKILRQTSPWAMAKNSGKALVPRGTPAQQYDRLNTELRRLGVFIVEVGELEQFYPAAGGHGPSWVNEVLSKNLAIDPALRDAREFVTSLLE